MRAGCGKVDVGSLGRRIGIARAVIARRGADGNAERGRIDTRRFIVRQRLRRRLIFGAAPAYRDDRGPTKIVVDRRIERVDKAIIRVGRKVDDDLRAGRDCAADFDVEQDLAVGAVGFAGRRVVRAADRYRNDPRRLDVQLRKIFVQLVGMVATAKL